ETVPVGKRRALIENPARDAAAQMFDEIAEDLLVDLAAMAVGMKLDAGRGRPGRARAQYQWRGSRSREHASARNLHDATPQKNLAISLWAEPSHRKRPSQYCLTNTLRRRGRHQRRPPVHGPAIDQFHRLVAKKHGAMHRPARHQEAFAGTEFAVRLAFHFQADMTLHHIADFRTVVGVKTVAAARRDFHRAEQSLLRGRGRNIRLLENRALGRGLCMCTHRQRSGKYRYKANSIKHLL